MSRGSGGGQRAGLGSLPPLPAYLNPRGRRMHRSGWRRGVSRLVSGLAALLSVSLLLLLGYAWADFRDFNNGLRRLHIATGRRPAGVSGVRGVSGDIDGQDEDILVVGNTDRSTLSAAQQHELKVGSDASLATDTMMIVHVPANGAKADLISLPRDSYVNIPGYGMDKLNAAYVLGYINTKGSLDAKRAAGANLLIKTVSDLTGLTIDHFVSVSMIGFVDISNAIGGVSVNLCHAVDDTVAHNRAIGSDGGSGLVLSAGRHTIHGVTALEFVRQRHGLPNGDLDRTARQRYFIIQAFHKIASAGVLLDPSQLHSLIAAVDNAIYVDSGLDLTTLALQMSALDPANITSKAIPFVRLDTVDVGSVEIVDPAQVHAFVANLIHPVAPTPKPSPMARPRPSHSAVARKPVSSGCIN